jgi:hypothetical protein
MFMTFPPYVAGPLVPVVVRVNAGAAPRFTSAPAAVVAPVPPDAGSNGDPSVSLPAAREPGNDALVPLIFPVASRSTIVEAVAAVV